MEEAFLSEKLKQALDEYNSYNGKNVNLVLMYKKGAENFLRKNGNSSKELERLILQSEEKIFKNNLGLILKKARYYSSFKGFHPYFHDFVSEGTIGLLKATKGKFDPRKGKFSNYLGRSISTQIMRKMREIQGNIDFPINFYLERRAFGYYLKRFKREYKRAPGDEELSDFSGMPIEKVKRIKLSWRCFYTPSLNKKLKDDDEEGDSLIDRVSSYRDSLIEERIVNKVLYEERIRLINQLPDKREKDILLEILVEKKPLKEIGLERGISKQRVGQLKEKAIENLKRMKEFSRLR